MFSGPQFDFLQAQESYVALVAGYGSGKTLSGAARLVKNLMESPGISQAYLAPTYLLVRDIFYPTIEKLLDLLDFPYRINYAKHSITIDGLGEINCYTMDQPHKIIGWEAADVLLDEFDTVQMSKALVVFRKAKARLRQKNPERKNQLYITTTPEGYRITYQLFEKDPLKDSRIIRMSTFDNEDNLPEGYIPDLFAQYPASLIQAYIYGNFINLTSGTVYYTFNRKDCSTDDKIKQDDVLFIGQDFNVGNMASAVFVKRGSAWSIVDEITKLRDTPDLIKTVKRRWPNHKVIFYPDASAKSRATMDASDSDVALLKRAGYNVRMNSKNPLVKDRVLSVNNAFEKGILKVNCDTAPNVALCLEQQAYDASGAPEKVSGFDHLNDATGYVVAKEMGITRPQFIKTNVW